MNSALHHYRLVAYIVFQVLVHDGRDVRYGDESLHCSSALIVYFSMLRHVRPNVIDRAT